MHAQFLSGQLIPSSAWPSEWQRQWIEFDQPLWLLCILPAAFACVWLSRSALNSANWLPRLQVMTRVAVITLLFAALAEPNWTRQAHDIAAIVVRDMSSSVPLQSQAALDGFLDASLARRSPEQRLGLVSAAKDAVIQQLPGTARVQLTPSDSGDVSATNLESALRTAATIAPGDSGARILLASDGNETRGSVLEEARDCAARGIVVDTVTLPADRSTSVRIEDVSAPAWGRAHSTANVRVVLRAKAPMTGDLSLRANGEPVPGGDRHIELDSGLTVVALPVELDDVGLQRFTVRFEPSPDSGVNIPAPELLRAETVTYVGSEGRLLVVAPADATVTPLVDALGMHGTTIERRSSSLLPVHVEDLAAYDAVVLVDQPASDIDLGAQQALRSYVHDAGGGLFVIGGPHSYGAGGWIGMPLANALPMLLDPPAERELPLGALAIVIDRSGSMGEHIGARGLTRQAIANEAAILALRALSRNDYVTIITFSGNTDVVIPLTPCARPEALASQVRQIGANGGTYLFPALRAAQSELSKMPGATRHVIALTDGQTAGSPDEGVTIAQEMRAHGITLSTVAIGDDANDPLLEQLARIGKGRSFRVTNANCERSLPQIFVDESRVITRTLLNEQDVFTPKIASADALLRGVESALPHMRGYVVTADRPGLATVDLRGPHDDPILARWNYGLGRVVAFTSDATSRWMPDWIGWPDFSRFMQREARWAMRPSADRTASAMLKRDGDRATFTLNVRDGDGSAINGATVTARAIGPDATIDFEMRQDGVGVYRGSFAAASSGTYLVSALYAARDGLSGSARAALVHRGIEEFVAAHENPAVLSEVARITGGRSYRLDANGANLWSRDGVLLPEIRTTAWCFFVIAAMFAFLLDVVVRRVPIQPRAIVTAIVRATTPPTTPPPRTNPTDSLAKAKARATAQFRGSRERGRDEPSGEEAPTSESLARLREAQRRTRNQSN